jgi:hypothetical protein
METFAYPWMDFDREAERHGQWCRCLQGARIWRGQDSANALVMECSCGLFGLGLPEGGEPWVGDARVLPGGSEMQVELTLAVAEQDHGAGASAETRARQSPGMIVKREIGMSQTAPRPRRPVMHDPRRGTRGSAAWKLSDL